MSTEQEKLTPEAQAVRDWALSDAGQKALAVIMQKSQDRERQQRLAEAEFWRCHCHEGPTAFCVHHSRFTARASEPAPEAKHD